MRASVVFSLIMTALAGSAAAAKITCKCNGEDYITGKKTCDATTFDTAQYKNCVEACDIAGQC